MTDNKQKKVNNVAKSTEVYYDMEIWPKTLWRSDSRLFSTRGFLPTWNISEVTSTVAEHIFDVILFFLTNLPLVKLSAPSVNMYAGGGAMGGGGNAWMKIMGIDQDKVKARHLQAEKEAKNKAKEGRGNGNAKEDIETGGEVFRER